MKQKIIIRVSMDCDKCRRKAMKIAAVAQGVNSVALGGKEKDQLEVTGDGVDSVCLTNVLRKKLRRHAAILSVGEVKDGDKEKKKDECKAIAYCSPYPPYPSYCQVVYDDSHPSNCSIM